MKFGRTALWTLLCVCCVVAIAQAQPMDCINPDVIVVASHADTIFVDHLNATKNCCSLLTIDVTSEDFVVDFVEGEAGDFCTCVCCFNHEYEAHGFVTGHYLVRVWYDEHLVGEAEVDVEGSEGGFTIGPSSKGTCLTLADAPDEPFRIATWGRMRMGFLSR